ncbi:hypothetical protein RIF29_25786 [Crotalaria pallida]|uniref:Uncharacterized protein n=1 Tax=Crotalaria pallida TaxID=3830 RepID=A0AAN9EMM1_CROPI
MATKAADQEEAALEALLVAMARNNGGDTEPRPRRKASRHSRLPWLAKTKAEVVTFVHGDGDGNGGEEGKSQHEQRPDIEIASQ